jgi:hypothetical protein
MQSTIPDGPQARRISLIPHVECTAASAGEPCDSQVDWVLTLGGVSDVGCTGVDSQGFYLARTDSTDASKSEPQ